MRYATPEARSAARRLRWVAYTMMVFGLIWVDETAGDIAMAAAFGFCVLAGLVGLTLGME